MNDNWLTFARQRREKRTFTPARQPKKLTVANLAKSWHIDKDRLASLIEKIAKEKEANVKNNSSS